VTFDGTPAPVLFSSFYQINVQAPYTLTPGRTTSIQITTSGGQTGTVRIPVNTTAAGLFTNQTNGRGQALAVNANGTVNSSTNPAAAGTYISLFASGLGAVTPTISAGTAAPNSPLSTVNGGVTVVIGGLTAAVSYAGLAPGFVGLYQINAQIPPTTQPGSNLVLVVGPNGYSSQNRTYIYTD
jgi:uncharacterized protein (TIGR03437 family)